MNRPRTVPMPAPALEALMGKINSKLDPELLERAAAWNSSKRLEISRKLRQWSEQLIASAAELKPLEKLDAPGSAAN